MGATATMVAAARAIANSDHTIDDPFAEPLVRAVGVDFLTRWATGELTAAGFDTSEPSAWIAEGLFGYLPPEAQDRLLDAVTELGAPGSRLGSEAVPTQSDVDVDAAREKMWASTAKWREHGFDLNFAELGFHGERNDVREYLGARGWTSVATPTADLLAANGFAPIPTTRRRWAASPVPPSSRACGSAGDTPQKHPSTRTLAPL